MTISLEVNHHFPNYEQRLDAIEAKLNRSLALLQTIVRQGETMSAELDALTSQVKKTTDAEDSAIALIQGLAAQIASIKTDPVALQALSDQLSAKADELAAAVVANTPAAPEA